MKKQEKSPRVSLVTTDKWLKRLFDAAEEKEKMNIADFGGRKVIMEDYKIYYNLWIETQPMGGEMYAKRDMEVALNNSLLFMEYQREDGRIPAMLSYNGSKIIPHFDWFQGYCFPTPAYKLYFYANLDNDYLQKLYTALKGHDEYLWKYRDSDGDGCLETWCVWDTGEDGSRRLVGAPDSWGGETPPSGLGKVPYESMDVMGYSYNGRDILAKISKLLGNGEEQLWREKAEEVRNKIKDYLWIPERHACFDRDCDNNIMDVLIHNNLRVMYHGAFSQQMADDFIRYHVLNPDEFWTKMPLPSIAVNEPLFHNHHANDWSGQPQGLTYQRAIQAFENYGHFAELTMLGEKLLEAAGENCIFTQQFEPFTGKAEPIQPKQGEYGPTILAVLEYIAGMYGIRHEENKIYWSGLERHGESMAYSQEWHGNIYLIENKDGYFRCLINNQELFKSSTDVRAVTDLTGKLLYFVGIDTVSRDIEYTAGNISARLKIKPNEIVGINGDIISFAPFDYPFSK